MCIYAYMCLHTYIGCMYTCFGNPSPVQNSTSKPHSGHGFQAGIYHEIPSIFSPCTVWTPGCTLRLDTMQYSIWEMLLINAWQVTDMDLYPHLSFRSFKSIDGALTQLCLLQWVSAGNRPALPSEPASDIACRSSASAGASIRNSTSTCSCPATSIGALIIRTGFL